MGHPFSCLIKSNWLVLDRSVFLWSRKDGATGYCQIEGPEGEDYAVEGEGLGEGCGCVDGGEGAHGGQPERVEGGAWVPDAADEVGEQQAGGEFEGDLEPGYSAIVGDAEEFEAGREKERIAGQADERGMEDAAAVGEGELAVQQDVGGDVAVDERVAAGLREGLHHPEAKDEATD